jgi:hypothetical protein
MLGEILEEPGMFMGMADSMFNPENSLIIADEAANYWFYSNQEAHRFNKVEEVNGSFICYREIEIFYFQFVDFPVTVEEYIENFLYFAFLYSEFDDDYNTIELQSGCLKIIFN